MNNEQQQVIGLAAAIQALLLVNDVAFKGQFSEADAAPLFQALLRYSPDDAMSAYDGAASLRTGLQAIPNLLNNQSNLELVRHLFSVIVIENKLIGSDTLLSRLRDKLENLRDSVNKGEDSYDDYYNDPSESDESINENEFADDETDEPTTGNPAINETVIAELAEIYKQTASTIEPRILVKGEAEYLRNDIHANQIRALLLAALRGASFFRHYEGSRRHIMFKSKQYIDIAKQLQTVS